MAITYNTAETTSLLIVILKDGHRITLQVQKPTTYSRTGYQDAMREAGQGVKGYRAYIHSSVLIDGTDVYNYGAGETLEVLGLEA